MTATDKEWPRPDDRIPFFIIGNQWDGYDLIEPTPGDEDELIWLTADELSEWRSIHSNIYKWNRRLAKHIKEHR